MTTPKQSSLPSSSARKPGQGVPQAANPISNPLAPNYRRTYGNRVPYGQGTLGQHVANMRTPRSIGKPPNTKTDLDPSLKRNLAAARLSDGTVVDGVSGKSGCSENVIKEKLDKLNEGRAADDQLKIEEMYSERQPCCRCEGLVRGNNPKAKVEWTVEYFDSTNRPNWTPEDKAAVAALNAAENAELKRVAEIYHGI
ncbi:nucleic acid/nucleotide deaminase domain-containing protein [Glycomyces sp. NPDC048151]|uniref:nucleic acid/nucleotide deaminase domain-containing protein n=1 Tax=Glycomyces sp. NPDC048151 TaxID=3364002 RepID=UPI0037177ACB